MQKLLIPFCACLLLAATLHAQVPIASKTDRPIDRSAAKMHSPESVCNFAGTIQQLGPHIGQSNDVTGDPIFLCLGDSLFIDHAGDFDVTGDPVPATPAGVTYAFYSCPPTVIGDNLPAILNDTCLITSVSGNAIVTGETNNGDTWFFNNGVLQNSPQITSSLQVPTGSPVQLYFAPITIDDNDGVLWEAGGPCVNANVTEQFSVVYLNAIDVPTSSINTSFQNDCLGRFRVKGGYPEWNTTATYTITITSVSNPSVSAVIYTPQQQLFNGVNVIFSVPEPGQYNVVIEDGKSCDFSMVVNMANCDSSDNVTYTFPDLVTPANTPICVPLIVDDVENIYSTSFSIQWDPNVLEFDDLGYVNPGVPSFNPATNLNTNFTMQGLLGVAMFDAVDSIEVANGDTLMSVCFVAIGPWESCSPVTITNNPTAVNVDNTAGIPLGLTVNPGSVCIDTIPLGFTTEVLNPTCGPLPTATLEVTATGGIPPYEVYIQNIGGGPVFNISIPDYLGAASQSNLAPGSYRVCIVDLNGTNLADSVCNVVQIDIQTLGASLDLTGLPTCTGLSNGSVTAQVLYNNMPVPNPDPQDYGFQWAGPAGVTLTQNIPTQVGVPAGQYFVTVTDLFTGCTAIAAGTLPNPAPISQDEQESTPAACSGVCDGSLGFEAQGGTPFPNGEYNYNWEYAATAGGPAAPFFNGVADSSWLANLCAGTYTVTVTDANGCTFVAQPIDIQNLRELTIDNPILNGPACAGLSTGQICIELQANPTYGAGATYSFQWTSTAGTFPQTDTGPQSCLNQLPAGTYNVTATETTSGCNATATLDIVDPQPLVITATSVNNPTCTNGNDGSITVAATGGTGPNTYLFTWGCDASGTGATQSNLLPGTYCVTVSDANACTDALTLDLMLPPPPTITGFDSTSVTCGSDGCLTVLAPTGTNFQWFAIDGTPLNNNQQSPQVCNLVGGTYYVVVTDANDCTNSDTVSLGAVAPLAFLPDVTYVQPSCFGLSDGSITVGATGGTPPYTFTWDSNQAGATANNLAAGVHEVTLTDANNCTVVDTFVLLQPPAIGAAQNSVIPATCASSCDGSVTIDAYYNTNPPTPGTFSFAWNPGGALFPTGFRDDLCPGTYNVTITDANGCSRVETVTISSPPPIVANANATPVTCDAGTNGTVSSLATPVSAGPFTYAWAGPNGASVGTTATVNNLPAGQYIVTVTDATGCTGVDTVIITSPPPIVVTLDVDSVSCFGYTDGSVSAMASGGNSSAGPYTYAWEDQANTVIGNTAEVEDLGAGSYFVTVTDALGCTGVAGPAIITEPGRVFGALEPLDSIQCNGGEVALIIDTIYGGYGGPYLFSLDNGPLLDSNYYNALTVTGGLHVITYVDQRNCMVTDTIDVFEPDPITVTFDPIEIEIELGDSIQLQPIIGGVALADIDTFLWTPTTGLTPPNVLEPYAYIFDSQNFTLTVTDPNGCQGSGTVIINVDPNRKVYIPNAFKPGADLNLNDRFVPVTGKGVSKINFMRVYDRWGGLMYSNDNLTVPTTEFTDGWDGRYNGKFVDPGVYVYVIEVEFLDGRVLLYRGDVTVVR